MGLIPDRWLEYKPIGAKIEGTRFIAFKVPLDKLDISKMNKEAEGTDIEMHDVLNTQIMFERIPNLGLVIDLTNTKRYYNSKDVTNLGIEYKKIFIPGRILPPQSIYEEFMSTVTDFLRRNAENDKLIGVHCTHGLNRTGLMICAYMIQYCNIQPTDAICRFETARGHKMERENYLVSLKKMTAEKAAVKRTSEELAVVKIRSLSPDEVIIHDNLRTLSTQTDAGIWLDTSTTRKKNKRKRNRSSADFKNVADIKGTVCVDGKHLISDGSGGYFMRVELNDVRPFPSNSSKPKYRNYPPNSTNIGHNPSGSYYSNQSLPHSSNNLPSSSGRFYSNHSRYPNEYHTDRRSADSYNGPYSQQNTRYFTDGSDLFN